MCLVPRIDPDGGVPRAPEVTSGDGSDHIGRSAVPGTSDKFQ